MILALDTSQNEASVTIQYGEQTSTRKWSKKASHSEVLNNQIISCLNEAHLSLNQIEGILVGTGPGSFTGIRVVLNTAKSLSYSLNIPIRGFDSIELICRQQTLNGSVTAISYGFRDIVYCATWELQENNHKLISPTAAVQFSTIDFAKSDFIVGNARKFFDLPNKFKTEANNENQLDFPQAEKAIELFASDLSPSDHWKNLTANYTRDSEPEEKRKTSTASS